MSITNASRSTFIAGSAAAIASFAVVRSPARAAEFNYKYAHNLPLEHPVNVRSIQMWNDVARETNGRLVVQTFGASVLGGDAALLSQLRSGAIQFLNYNAGFLATLTPAAELENVAFAFKDEKTAFEAMDGDLGAYRNKELAAKGIFTFPKVWGFGFRQMTSGTKPIRAADDLIGFKMRVPTIAIWVNLFKALGASPTPVAASEIYTALQTHLVDGQENPYLAIETFKIFEVQKSLSETNHMWTSQSMFANPDAWTALPPDIRDVVMRNAAKAAIASRRDAELLNNALKDKLQRQGLTLYKPDTAPFRAKLGGYYAALKNEIGATGWTILEKYAGKLG